MTDWNHTTPLVDPADLAKAMVVLRVEGDNPSDPSQDNLQQISAADLINRSRVDLSAFTGSTLVGADDGSSGTLFTTVQEFIDTTRGLPVSIKAFGAKVDGTTDDTFAFANAIASGRDIMLEPGTMVITPVTMANNDQRIIGSRSTTIKRKASSAGNLITITGASCALLGFKIDGNSANQTYSYNGREVFVSGAKATVSGLRIDNPQSHGIGLIKGALAPIITDNEINNAGDCGIFVDGNAGTGSDPAYGVCENNTVVDFGLQGGGGGATTSIGIGVRSATGGWRVTDNLVRNTAARTNDQLGIECWTNSNNMIVQGNVIDGSVANSMEFGLSVTGYGSVVSGNLVLGTASYAIESIDRGVSITGNVVRSPTGAGISINLNSGHTDPGDVITITGNTVENTSSTSASAAGIIVDGDSGVTPIAITIGGNTIHGLSQGIKINSQVVGYSITGNTLYNTGSTAAAIIADGAHGVVSGNSLTRANTAGTGNGGHISTNGTGVFVSANRIAGSGYIDNAVLIGSSAVNTVVAANFMTGCTNAVFSNSTASSVVVVNNVSTAGYALNAANYASGNFNLTNGSVVGQKMPLSLGVFTVSTLPSSSVTQGSQAYVTDANATTFNSIVAGGGSNKVPVTYDGTNWRIG